VPKANRLIYCRIHIPVDPNSYSRLDKLGVNRQNRKNLHVVVVENGITETNLYDEMSYIPSDLYDMHLNSQGNKCIYVTCKDSIFYP
jgi:hypothetical protein